MEEVTGSCCNLHKATHFLISSTTFVPSGSTSINIATLQVLPKKQNKIPFPDWPEPIIRKCHSTSISLPQSCVYFIWIQLLKTFQRSHVGYHAFMDY